MKLFRHENWVGLIGVGGLIAASAATAFAFESGPIYMWRMASPLFLAIPILGITWLAGVYKIAGIRWMVPRRGWIVFALGLACVLAYVLSNNTLAAWGSVVFIFAFFLLFDDMIIGSITKPHFIFRWVSHIAFALLCGAIICLIAEMESHFADEEFFAAVQAILLAVYWLSMRGIWSFMRRLVSSIHWSDSKGIAINVRWVAVATVAVLVLFMAFAIHGYQTSFYPVDAPFYPGISSESPFLCGSVPADPQSYPGDQTFTRLLALVEANPSKGSPEYGMLALATGKPEWKQSFHDTFLEEARQALFTGPSGSVKSVQHEAALRAYYYSKVRAAFPQLFTSAEEDAIHSWFAVINRRTFTLEPVDFLYALAFSKWPQGPYENQENGAGLLALLESAGLANPAMSSRNQAYLHANPRGWQERFRVTDDAAVYQPDWIENAFFQSLYTGTAPSTTLHLSFEWLLLQALPDGAPLQYNHIGSADMDGIAFLGAELTKDSHFLWAAGRAIDYLENRQGYAYAQPGLEKASDLTGTSPIEGSCLLYGDSGLPNRVGPLAPDKIVLRDGWQAGSSYALLNLRFTGWHRYKATNTLTMLYKDEPLVVENTSGKTFSWLPVGRSLFRDKRIPRENLNGLVVGRTGMSAVMYTLTSIGGAWSQDPPYYADVVSFDPAISTSVTEIKGWRGWSQRRTVSLHAGELMVADDASGPAGSPAAVIWHFASGSTISGTHVVFRNGAHPAEADISLGTGETIRSFLEETGLRVEIRSRGQLQTSITFHLGDPVEAP